MALLRQALQQYTLFPTLQGYLKTGLPHQVQL